ncbi:MAG TPA: SIMPL domain-containing protein [Nitrososphaeraceae archaeon]|jgi:uncharacterized protein YggE|nr:SIMPL domain-containing protein [Nitrososphaeraceae archaeon]
MRSKQDASRLTMIVIFVMFTGVTILFLHTAEVSAQYAPASASNGTASVNGTIHTTGTAYARLQPDKVYVTIGIENTEATTDEALAVNSKLMNGIISQLMIQGLMENETSTSSFNIYPLYNFTESGARLNITGFNVLNSIRIETANLDNVSEWIDTAVELGANDVSDIFFAVSDNLLEYAKNKLITDAIDNAKEKAETAASFLGLKIIGVKSLDIEGSTTIPPGPPFPFPRAEMAAQTGGASPSTPILPGEQQVSTSVSAIFLTG